MSVGTDKTAEVDRAIGKARTLCELVQFISATWGKRGGRGSTTRAVAVGKDKAELM